MGKKRVLYQWKPVSTQGTTCDLLSAAHLLQKDLGAAGAQAAQPTGQPLETRVHFTTGNVI